MWSEAGKSVVILNVAKRSERSEESPDGFHNIGKSLSCKHSGTRQEMLLDIEPEELSRLTAAQMQAAAMRAEN